VLHTGVGRRKPLDGRGFRGDKRFGCVRFFQPVHNDRLLGDAGMADYSRFCCINPACSEAGKRGADNLTTDMFYGPGKQYRILKCTRCRAKFSERRFSAAFRLRLPAEKCKAILNAIRLGYSQRETAEDEGVNRRTVSRFVRLVGDDGARLVERVKAVARDCLGESYNSKDFEPPSLEEQLRNEYSFESYLRQAKAIAKGLGLSGS
jgi:hypothetical protein